MPGRRAGRRANEGGSGSASRVCAVLAPNAYKGALSALEAAAAMARGVFAAMPGATVVACPMADGGDGTLDVLLGAAFHPRLEQHPVSGPLGAPVRARLGWLDAATAVIEMADASGLRLLAPDQRDAARASSRGTGELLRIALDAGAREVLVGVGGSASTDGGAGVLQAVGVRLLDGAGAELPPGGLALRALSRIDRSGLHAGVGRCRITVISDVANPLLGPRGAAHAFGPQKGADPALVDMLETALHRYAGLLDGPEGRIRDLPGAGACGGIGFGLVAGCGASLVRGAAFVADRIGLDAALQQGTLVLTGEGRLDATTLSGKAPAEVARRAHAAGLPVYALVGRADPLPSTRFDEVVELGRGIEEQTAMRRSAELLEVQTTALIGRVLG